MHAGQSESRVSKMIKLGAQPRIDRVTLLAFRRETAGHMVRRRRLLKRALVA